MHLCILAFYFGQLPPYFDLTVRSMGANHDVDWIIFTDQDVDSFHSNVRIERRSFEMFKDELQGKFDFPLHIPRPYKLADTRPAFGYIFQDMLAGYDYWGFSDLDIIFGSIAKLLAPAVTKGYDKLFRRGHFSIYRNTAEARNWFRDEGFGTSFRESMANPSIQYWDEWQGINRILSGLGIATWDPLDLRFDIDTHHYLPRVMYVEMKAPIFFWEAGGLFATSKYGPIREGIYMHLQKRPMQSPADELNDAPRFYIYGNRFTSMREPRISPIKDAIGSVQFRAARLDKRSRR